MCPLLLFWFQPFAINSIAVFMRPVCMFLGHKVIVISMVHSGEGIAVYDRDRANQMTLINKLNSLDY